MDIFAVVLIVIIAMIFGYCIGTWLQNRKVVNALVDAYTRKECIEVNNGSIDIIVEPKSIKANIDSEYFKNSLDNEWVKLTRKEEE